MQKPLIVYVVRKTHKKYELFSTRVLLDTLVAASAKDSVVPDLLPMTLKIILKTPMK